MAKYTIIDRKTETQKTLNGTSAWNLTGSSMRNAETDDQKKRILSDYLNGIQGNVDMKNADKAFKKRYARKYEELISWQSLSGYNGRT